MAPYRQASPPALGAVVERFARPLRLARLLLAVAVMGFAVVLLAVANSLASNWLTRMVGLGFLVGCMLAVGVPLMLAALLYVVFVIVDVRVAVTLYEHGLELVGRPPVPWDSVVALDLDGGCWRITTQGGAVLALPRGLDHDGALARTLRRHARERLLPRLLERRASGHALSFGQVVVASEAVAVGRHSLPLDPTLRFRVGSHTLDLMNRTLSARAALDDVPDALTLVALLEHLGARELG
ncbi:MAG: hypothetical protein IT370_36580 [Deltaproteobacteria bacterium]|nr:hypothetical protein [Deltaproteobacteria bacterium]